MSNPSRLWPVLIALVVSLAVADDAPKSGERFEINSKMPKYDAVLFVYDADNKAWPSFCHGRPEDGGYWVYDDTKHRGAFEIHFDRIAQNLGDQSRRVLGETVVDGKTDLGIKLISIGEAREIKIDFNDDYSPIAKSKRNPEGVNDVIRSPAVLEVTVRGTTVRADAEVRVKSGGKTSICIDAFFTVDGKDLGLKLHPGPLNIHLWLKAYPPNSK